MSGLSRASAFVIWKVSLLLLLMPLVSGTGRADPTTVSGFSMPGSAIAFHNYSIWENSLLPDRLQLPHCTSMALLARQVYLHALFIPELPKTTPPVYRALLKEIYGRSTEDGASDYGHRVPLPGYSSFFEMTSDSDIEPVVRDVLGNSIEDAFRPNWNWGIADVYVAKASKWIRRRQERKLRDMIGRDRPALVYLTDGTAEAHAVLLYSYEEFDDRVVYQAYDSNHMGDPVQLTFWKDEAKMEHPDLGKRDPWVLHPY